MPPSPLVDAVRHLRALAERSSGAMLALGLILALGSGFTLLPINTCLPAEEKPQESAVRPAQSERQFGEGHRGWVGVLQLSPDGRTVFSAGSDEEVYQWDLITGQALAHFHGGQWRAKSVAFSPDHKLIAAGSAEKTIALWESRGGRLLGRWNAHEGRVMAVAFTPDGKMLLSSGDDCILRFWDVATHRELRRSAQPSSAPVAAFVISADGKTLFTGGEDGLIHEWEPASAKHLRTLSPRNRGRIERLVLSPDRKYLAWAGSNVHVFDLTSEKDLVIGDGVAYAYNVAFSPDGRSLVTTHHDRSVRIWEMASGKLRTHFEGHGGAVASVLFMPGGRRLLSGGSDGVILVWDLTGRLQKGRLRPAELKPAEVEAAWKDLVGEDGEKAYQAVWTLAADPRQTLPLLQKHLRPAAVIDEKRVAQLLKDLDDDTFAVREKGSKELARLGDTAEPALRKALQGNPSPEMRLRIRQLLERLRRGPDYWRQTRMLEVLEHIETPEARQMLKTLAKGAPGAWLTQEAKAALDRRP